MLDKEKILITAQKIAHHLMKNYQLYPNYKVDLGLISLLYLFDATQNQKYLDFVLKVWDFREQNSSEKLNWHILFVCLNYELWLYTKDDKYIKDFISVTDDMKNTLQKDKGGAVVYNLHPNKKMIFVDMLQGYATFMARAGLISGDNKYFTECISQYQIFRNILRDKKTGLWHQGRNWSETPNFISPGFWNRGQGWVIAGMVKSLECMPTDSSFQKSMIVMLNEFSETLIKYQDIRGMWHQNTDKPEAYPETSGSAMFVHYLQRAINNGWLDKQKYQPIVEKGVIALSGFVTKEGIVLNTSFGCGPLQSDKGYQYRPAPPGEPHSAGTMIMALTAPFIV